MSESDTADIYEKVYEQHDDIVAAIQARDGERAQAAMQVHLESIGEKLVNAILKLKPSFLIMILLYPSSSEQGCEGKV